MLLNKLNLLVLVLPYYIQFSFGENKVLATSQSLNLSTIKGQLSSQDNVPIPIPTKTTSVAIDPVSIQALAANPSSLNSTSIPNAPPPDQSTKEPAGVVVPTHTQEITFPQVTQLGKDPKQTKQSGSSPNTSTDRNVVVRMSALHSSSLPTYWGMKSHFLKLSILGLFTYLQT